MRFVICLVVVVGLAGCKRAGGARDMVGADDEALYALGYAQGQNIQQFHLGDHELALVEMGLADATRAQTLAVDVGVYGPKIDGLARRRGAAAPPDARLSGD